MSNNSGFTLIEAIIVLAIIGILTGIASIAMSQWLPGYRLKSAARDLFNNMHYAKSQAITENREWAVLFDDGTPNQYTVVSSGPDNTLSTSDDVELRSVVLSHYGSGVGFGYGSGVKQVDDLSSAVSDAIGYDDSGVTWVVLKPNGTTDAGYVYLTGSHPKTYAVGTFASGLVRLKQWDGSAWQ